MANYAGNEKDPNLEEEELPVLQRVAVLMVALGEDAAGQVMRFLSDYEIEEITQAIASLGTVSSKLIDTVLEDFETHLFAGEWLAQGGADFAREILERAVGPRKAQEIL
ncbi:MAG: flagellar motor switch protein FliG, partial [Gemmatimonadetes bacterium]|nr:flagellar motor switch protein FliG [Gemmatimonadota bacterium]